LQCPYCSNPLDFARHTDELKTGEWQRVLTEAAALGVVQAHFSGGEPLLRADAPQIIRHARDLGLYTNLSTGGTLLTEKLAGELREAGLDSLQVSLQDADAENSDRMAGGAPSFEKKSTRRGWSKRPVFSLTLNVVLQRQNIGRIEAMIALAEELGAERLELANTQFNGWALKNRAALLPSRAQVENAAEAAAAHERAAQGPHGNSLCAAGLFRAVSEALPARLGARFPDRGRRWHGAALPDRARDPRIEIRQCARKFPGENLV
jgi:PqqA peptide cyclase